MYFKRKDKSADRTYVYRVIDKQVQFYHPLTKEWLHSLCSWRTVKNRKDTFHKITEKEALEELFLVML